MGPSLDFHTTPHLGKLLGGFEQENDMIGLVF